MACKAEGASASGKRQRPRISRNGGPASRAAGGFPAQAPPVSADPTHPDRLARE